MDRKESFYLDLKKKVLEAVGDGRNKLVFWGYTPACIRLLTHLNRAGLLEHTVRGVIDSDSKKQNLKIFHYSILSPKEVRHLEIDTLVIASDEKKEAILSDFSAVDGRTPLVLNAGSENYRFDDPVYREIIASCPVPSQAGGYPEMLIHIYQSLVHLVKNGIEGDVAEFGAFQCGTTIVMAKILEHLNCHRKIYAFDTFDGFPPKKSALDMYNGEKCEFHHFDVVRHHCSRHESIELVRGDICETYGKLKGVPLMFSFFDTDNYNATKKALELCYRQTVKGGILAFDHYCSKTLPKTIGERIAVREILSDKNVFNLHGTGIFIKHSD